MSDETVFCGFMVVIARSGIFGMLATFQVSATVKNTASSLWTRREKYVTASLKHSVVCFG
jgi:hypothetical protein